MFILISSSKMISCIEANKLLDNFPFLFYTQLLKKSVAPLHGEWAPIGSHFLSTTSHSSEKVHSRRRSDNPFVQIPALEFLRTKRRRVIVGVDMYSYGGHRNENVFVAAEKCLKKCVEPKVFKRSNLEFVLQRGNNFDRRVAFRGVRSLARERAMTLCCSSNRGASVSVSEKRVLVGCGGAALDFLASVAKFPQPDDKIRTTELQVQGGGNVGNALTAAARLGLECRIFTKVANDGPGSQILAELQGDGVDVSNVVVAEEGVSPFTYVIVDKETNTRTCIHTTGSPPLHPQELTPGIIDTLLDGADLVYFDGRLAETALVLAEEASKRQLPMLIDAERPREGLDDMLTYATYVVSSAKFPQSWTSAPTVAEALLHMMLRLPRLKFVIVTLGASGCIMLERHTPDPTEAGIEDAAVEVNGLVESLSREAGELRDSHPTAASSKVCRLCSADISNLQQQIWGRFHVGTAEAIPASELVDTTGAGDGFIGGVMYAILAGLSPQKLLALGATVAAGSCRALGARPGLPTKMDSKVVSLL